MAGDGFQEGRFSGAVHADDSDFFQSPDGAGQSAENRYISAIMADPGFAQSYSSAGHRLHFAAAPGN